MTQEGPFHFALVAGRPKYVLSVGLLFVMGGFVRTRTEIFLHISKCTSQISLIPANLGYPRRRDLLILVPTRFNYRDLYDAVTKRSQLANQNSANTKRRNLLKISEAVNVGNVNENNSVGKLFASSFPE